MPLRAYPLLYLHQLSLQPEELLLVDPGRHTRRVGAFFRSLRLEFLVRFGARHAPHPCREAGCSRTGSSFRQTPTFTAAPPPPQTGGPTSSMSEKRVSRARITTWTSRLARVAPRQ